MEIINTVIAVVAAVGSLVVIVGTVVWAVGQIQATTQSLVVKIEYLGEQLRLLRELVKDGFDDHEERLRAVEQKR
jgi:hypothetical protein